MPTLLRSRLIAAGLHFLASFSIFMLLLLIVIKLWYPQPHFSASGGLQGLTIIALVDLVLGPLITLIIYNVTKPKTFSAEVLRNMDMLCDVVIVSLEMDELPPPHVLNSFDSWDDHAQLGQLQHILSAFLNYHFLQAKPRGKSLQLEVYAPALRKLGLGWFHELLSLYLLLAQNDFNTAGSKPLQTFMAERQDNSIVLPPLQLIMYVMGETNDCASKTNKSINSLLHDYLSEQSLSSLIAPLSKFLQLKRPQPSQKSVTRLDQALARIDLSFKSHWRDSLAQIILLSLKSRCGSDLNQQQWEQLPEIASLCGFIAPPQVPRVITLSGQGKTQLTQLESGTDRSKLSYPEMLQYEMLRCRLLSETIDNDLDSLTMLNKQLDSVFTLCSSGVPEAQRQLANNALDATIEWFCHMVKAERLPMPSAQSLRLPLRHNHRDYRLLLLHFLASNGQSNNGSKHQDEQSYTHIDASLFYFALQESEEQGQSLDVLLEQFYWPLTGETQKNLLIYIFREIFSTYDDYEIQETWEQFQPTLFDLQREPLASVIQGKPCEAEWLLYVALISNKHPQAGVDWIKEEHIAPLLRSADTLLGHTDNEWLDERIEELLLLICREQMFPSLLAAIEPLVQVLQQLLDLSCLLPNLQLLLRHINQQKDSSAEQYQALYKYCRAYAKLLPLLPRENPKGKPRAKAPSPNLDLFGDL